AKASDRVLVACPVTVSLVPPFRDSSRPATLLLSSLHSLSTPTNRCANTPATYWLCSLPRKGRISMVCRLTCHTVRSVEATRTRRVRRAPTTAISSSTSRRTPVRVMVLTLEPGQGRRRDDHSPAGLPWRGDRRIAVVILRPTAPFVIAAFRLALSLTSLDLGKALGARLSVGAR